MRLYTLLTTLNNVITDYTLALEQINQIINNIKKVINNTFSIFF